MAERRSMPVEPSRTRGRPARRQSSADARTPPNNLASEESLLGAMLLSRDAIAAAVEGVASEDFYRPIHGHIFDAIRSLYAQGEGVDPVTVADELGRAGLLDAVGGLAALLSLQANTPATSNAGRYAKIVADHALFRALIAAGGEIAAVGYQAPDDVLEAAEAAEAAMDAVRDRLDRGRGSRRANLYDGLNDWLSAVEADVEVGREPGLPTGLWKLDKRLVGLRPGQLVIVGARPAMGKSQLAVTLAIAAAVEAGERVLFATVEMRQQELVERLVAAHAGVSKDNLRRRRITDADWRRISAALGRLTDAPLVILDDPALTLGRLRHEARRARRDERRLGLVVVDYLQLMSSDRRGENRQVEVAEISRGLKVMAGDLEVPIVALSQLSRNVEARADKRPMMSDLRETGSIENDADVILFLYRDEVYDRHSERRGIMEVIVAKQRNGPTGTVSVAYDAATGRITDPRPQEAEEPLSMAFDGESP